MDEGKKFKTFIDSLDIEIDSSKIVENSYSFQMMEGKYDFRLDFFSPDSVQVNYSYQDTLFKISEQQLLRRFKGHYFLNYKRSDENWKVRRLTLREDNLSFSKVILPEDIEKLEAITEVKEIKSNIGKLETKSYQLNPSRKQLKKLMQKRFSETKRYKKLR